MMTTVTFPQSHLLAGAARGDITPPVGIYHRMWGAATHDRSTGVHRPLTATALALSPIGGTDAADVAVLIAIDHCLLWKSEMDAMLSAVSGATGIPESRITVCFSHTHAAGLMDRRRQALPGGDRIGPYLDRLAESVSELTREATRARQPAHIVYGRGWCDLAANRDFYDTERAVYVCGYNPEGAADHTLLAARITTSQGTVLATLVNYACHPTTLAWENTLISPDYPGAMREVIEQATAAPCFFLQGASGDLGPREGYVGDPRVADRHGRRLGYAALSVIESLPAPDVAFVYRGPVVSGATLGTWDYVPLDDTTRRRHQVWRSRDFEVALPYRADLPSPEQLQRELHHWQQVERTALDEKKPLQARDARAMAERAARRMTRYEHVPPGSDYPYQGRVYQFGSAFWVLLNGEHYNVLQRRLRDRFPEYVVLVGTLANGSHVWYLPDADSYGKGLYQEEASIVARGGLERVLDAVEQSIAAWIEEERP